MNLLQRWKQTTISNKALVITGCLAAFGTLFYAGAATIQVCIMRKSARDASWQMEKLIQQAEKNASAASQFANSASQIQQTTGNAVLQLKRAADDSENAIKQASKNAQDALDASIKSSHLDERAWVGIVRVDNPEGSATPNSVFVK